MARASNISSGRVVKYNWPGIPELTIEEIEVVQDVDKVTTEKVIVEAIDSSGAKWKAEGPPRVPGWYVTFSV